MNTKTVLITLASIAGVLGLIAFFVVFYAGSGSYVVTSNGGNNSTSSGLITLPHATSTLASSTSTSAGSSNTSGATSTADNSGASFATDFSSPAISWNEGRETMGITGAALVGNQLTFKMQIAMGATGECVPMNLRLVKDESGTLQAPNTEQFAFPESGSCEGAPNATYNAQEVVFTVNPAAMPLFFLTGGTSNVYFEVATTTDGGLSVTVPSTSD